MKKRDENENESFMIVYESVMAWKGERHLFQVLYETTIMATQTCKQTINLW